MMMMIMVMMIVRIFFFLINICELRNRNPIRVFNDDDDGVILFLMNRVLKGIWWGCLIVKR